ncbi:hypothetical protein SMAC4_13638 [Sordaria macrospora]|uniref:uncharacterized protein n=1 Tax=Sordaria macrospora TaxID=5147 RepID=UPI002B30ABFF|nr:hypothetical protein SMAC4_13638 [Sordaria macrospora]
MEISDHSFIPSSFNSHEGGHIFWTQLVSKEALEESQVLIRELRNLFFHAIYVDLQAHLKECGHPLELFCIPNIIVDRMEPDLNLTIHSILCLHNLHGRYKASKLRKIFMITVLSSGVYTQFFVDMLRTNNDHHQFELSDHSLPIKDSHMRGLNDKHADAFREFFWYQYLFSEGYCVGPCRFKQELGGEDRQTQYIPAPYDGKDLPRKMEEVRSAALTLSLVSHSDCPQRKKVGFSRPCSSGWHLWASD